MLLKNYAYNFISNDEILKCINLLPSRYKQMNVIIKVFNNKVITFWDWIIFLRKDNDINMLKSILNKNIGGLCGYKIDGIRLFAFNYHLSINNNYNKYFLIKTLLHELRHHYQKTYFPTKYNNAMNKYVCPTESHLRYKNQWIEQDANNFTKYIIKKNKNQIYKILNINE